jgi:hypothetical protein
MTFIESMRQKLGQRRYMEITFSVAHKDGKVLGQKFPEELSA